MGMREKLIELLREVQYLGGLEEKIADHLIASGVTIPVRCKDCVHMKNQFNARFCNVWCMYNGMGDEGYCNYGERRTNARTD